jgi:hypothetical protein
MMADSMKKHCCTLLSILVLAGCTSLARNTPTPAAESVVTRLALTETATAPIPPTLTNTVVPATITPHPTLSPSEVTQFIDKLASTDEICLLPCWGGIIPGETNWNDVQSFLESFAKVRRHSPSSPKGFAVDVPLPDRYPDDLLWLSIFLDEKDTVKYIRGWRYNLFVDQLFRTYGKPEQIHLYILGVLPSDNVEEFTFLFSYRSRGFFLTYTGKTLNQSFLEICPSSIIEGPYFWLWDPQDNEAMNTIVNSGPDYYFYGDWPQYQEIAIATKGEVTVDLFYEMYSTSSSMCFRVPSPSFP